MKFAIIGAGMAGLACADAISAAGHSVTLYDKGRGPGGRLSTRRLHTILGEVMIDHGAQYFTVRDPAFKRLVDTWANVGIVAPWLPASADAWVGVPGMSAIVKQLASGHKVTWDHRVTGMVRKGTGWWLMSENAEDGPFDAVLLAIPAEQAAVILSLHDLSMARVALMARSQPCWAGMFVFDRPLDGMPSVIRDRGDLAWAARNNAKPGRPAPEAWTVQASPAWSSARLEYASGEIAELLLAILTEATGTAVPRPVMALAHRWRHALSAGTGDGALWNPDLRIGVCGDWLLGPRVECAWQSGQMLAQRCIGSDGIPGAASTQACGSFEVAGKLTSGFAGIDSEL
ncbi:MAG: FAD-dependent oxidoreductase [Novosphingobium sp.]|nr:FAD-dependent oxidoreductase [Novosphingobium sp.]